MDALFVVPVMVSDEINPKLVPALTKMVERNIILTNAGVFKVAALKKYGGLTKTIRSEGNESIDDLLSEGDYDKEREAREKAKHERDMTKSEDDRVQRDREQIGKIFGTTGGSGEVAPKGPTTTDLEKIELPSGITFFHTISLEPTFLTINISMRKSLIGAIFGSDSSASRNIMIGVKCVPYKAKSVENIFGLMQEMRSMSVMKSFFFRNWNAVKNRIPLTDRRAVYTGEKTGEATDIIFAPNSSMLTSSTIVRFMMKPGSASSWSTMVMLSTSDFRDRGGGDLQDTMMDYRKMVRSGWGDMVIVDEPKDRVFFCTTALGACYEMPIAYLRQVLNLSNVIDFESISRSRTPFRVSSVLGALRRGPAFEGSTGDIEGEILRIIRG